MESKFIASTKRWLAILGFLGYDILQIIIVGYLEVRPDDNLIFRYTFGISDKFRLSPLYTAGLFILPFAISFFLALNSVRGRGMVQVLGPDSLMKRVKMEFAAGNPEGREFSQENVQHLLEEIAEGEAPGTIKNLEMLFSVGNIVQNLLDKADIKSVKRVYMSDELAPNAFTLRVIPLPFVGQDWIIINRNVVDILTQNEIEAVVAHEVGHAVRKDSWINSFLYSPRVIIIVLWAVILADMASIILGASFGLDSALRVMFLFFFIGFVRILMNLGTYFTSFAYKKAELLADYYAANLVGSEILVNALIKIGRRGEVIRSVNVELDWMEKQFTGVNAERMSMRVLGLLEPSEKSKKKAREFAIEAYVRAKIGDTFRGLKVQVDQEDMEKLVEKAVKNLLQERGMSYNQSDDLMQLTPEQIEELTHDPTLVDRNEDEYLDKDEISELVSNIRKSGKKIFETEALEDMGIIPAPNTHPGVSDRILFLYDNTMEKESND